MDDKLTRDIEKREIRKAVGAKLRAIREAHGLTLHQVALNYARETGKNPEQSDAKGYVSKVENGALLPRRESLLALGKSARCTTAELDELLRTALYLPESIAGLEQSGDTLEVVRLALRQNQALSDESRRIIEQVVQDRLEADMRQTQSD